MKSFAIWASWLALVASAHTQERFVPPPISAFDGSAWGQVRLDETTDRDIKRLYRTTRGALRPEAIVLIGAEGAPFRAQVLLDGRGDSARAIAIRVQHTEQIPQLEDLIAMIGEPAAYGYDPDRFSDWRLVAWPDRGILAFQGNDRGDRDETPVLLLTTPERARTFLSRFREDPSRIRDWQDPMDTEERRIQVGSVSASVSGTGVTLRDRDDIENDLRRLTERYADRDWVDLSGGNAGSISVSATATFSRRNGGSVSATVTLRGRNAYGEFSVSGSGSDTFRSRDDRPVIDDDRWFREAVEDALANALRGLERELRRRLPRSPAQASRLVWDQWTATGFRS